MNRESEHLRQRLATNCLQQAAAAVGLGPEDPRVIAPLALLLTALKSFERVEADGTLEVRWENGRVAEYVVRGPEGEAILCRMFRPDGSSIGDDECADEFTWPSLFDGEEPPVHQRPDEGGAATPAVQSRTCSETALEAGQAFVRLCEAPDLQRRVREEMLATVRAMNVETRRTSGLTRELSEATAAVHSALARGDVQAAFRVVRAFLALRYIVGKLVACKFKYAARSACLAAGVRIRKLWRKG